MTAFARAVLAVAKFVAPESRKGWIDAMAAEFRHVPSGQKNQFALGAAEFSITAMMEEVMFNKVNAGSFVIMLGSAFLAILGISNGFRNFAQDSTVSVAFVAVGLLWLAAFVAAMLRRWELLTRVATGGLAASFALGLAWSISVPALEPNRSLFGALALEAVFLFTVLLATGALLRKLALSAS